MIDQGKFSAKIPNDMLTFRFDNLIEGIMTYLE